ncbi:hypothetical protein WJX84_012233 [Apatococcus fuscideae]|uniref:Uncharacterized protein n=1 Tax=Apatococcus fuscideae TaxID=2026836 RepID=A0AAW1SKI7_9CHLO
MDRATASGVKRAFRPPSRLPGQAEEAPAPKAKAGKTLPHKLKEVSELPFVQRLPAILSSTLPSIDKLGASAAVPNPLQVIGRLPHQQQPATDDELLPAADSQRIYSSMVPCLIGLSFHEMAPSPQHNTDDGWFAPLVSRLNLMGSVPIEPAAVPVSPAQQSQFQHPKRLPPPGTRTQQEINLSKSCVFVNFEAPLSDADETWFNELETVWASPKKQQEAISRAYEAASCLSTALLQQAFA